MAQLSTSVQESVLKSSTLRLQHNLLRAGVDEETVASLGRQEFIATRAQIMADGKDRPDAAVARKTPVEEKIRIERATLKMQRPYPGIAP